MGCQGVCDESKSLLKSISYPFLENPVQVQTGWGESLGVIAMLKLLQFPPPDKEPLVAATKAYDLGGSKRTKSLRQPVMGTAIPFLSGFFEETPAC